MPSRKSIGTLFEDTRDRRTLVGQGAQDVVGFIRAMREVGFAGPWGVEILSIEHRQRPLIEALTVARDTTLDAFQQADQNKVESELHAHRTSGIRHRGKELPRALHRGCRDCELVGIVARAPATIARARADWPETPIFGSVAEMIDGGVDAVTITTPPATRRELVLEAVGRGIHVVADKPFAPVRQQGSSWSARPRAQACC